MRGYGEIGLNGALTQRFFGHGAYHGLKTCSRKDKRGGGGCF